MGCDIHLFAERRENGAWRILPPPPGKGWTLKAATAFRDNPANKGKDFDDSLAAPYRYEHERDPHNLALIARDGEDEASRLQSWFSDRNYRLFAMLADVRNGRGFAGCDTGDRLEPIAAPRGVPFDASPEYKEEVDGWGVDGHSHTYFTVAELRTYFSAKMGEQFLERGCISGQQAEALMEKRENPNSWSGDIMGRGIRVIPLDEYGNLRTLVEHTPDGMSGVLARNEARLPLNKAPEWFRRKYPPDEFVKADGYRVYVRATWPGGYNDDAGRFLKLLDELETFGAADDLRIVCFFDN